MSLEFRKTLVLSTAHIQQATLDRLDPPFIGCHTFGAYFWVPTEQEETATPPDLAAVLNFARRHGCQEVKFDSDACTIDELPTYTWI